MIKGRIENTDLEIHTQEKKKKVTLENRRRELDEKVKTKTKKTKTSTITKPEKKEVMFKGILCSPTFIFIVFLLFIYTRRRKTEERERK